MTVKELISRNRYKLRQEYFNWQASENYYQKITSIISHQKSMTKAESPKNSPFAIVSILVQMDSIELTRFEVSDYDIQNIPLRLVF